MWQDYVLTATQVFFCITLIPMLRTEHKPPLLASIPTSIVLFIGAITVATLHLWLAGVSQAIVSMQWFVLAYQRIKQNKNKALK